MAQLPDKVPPQSPDAEAYILGCLLLGNKMATPKVLEKLRPTDFYKPAHQTIFQAVQEMFAQGTEIDLISLPQYLQDRTLLEGVGGRGYLSMLTDIVPLATNVDHYIELILEKSARRQLISAALKMVGLAYDEEVPLDEVLSQSEAELYKLTSDEARQGFTDFFDLMSRIYAQTESVYKAHKEGREVFQYPVSGYNDLDEMIGGFRPAELIVLAARPSVGKTSLALNFAHHAATGPSHSPVAFFSLEMSEIDLGKRLLSQLSKINTQRLSQGWLVDRDWEALADTIGTKIQDIPLYFDTSPGVTPVEMKAKCRRLQAEKGLGIVIVDYLQLIQSKRKMENRVQEVSEMTRSLKIMAKELDICVIALSQMSRDIEKHPGRKPVLSDLRESGAIEQDADVVMFLHVPSKYSLEREVNRWEGNGGESGEEEPPQRNYGPNEEKTSHVLRLDVGKELQRNMASFPEIESFIKASGGSIDDTDFKEIERGYYILYHFTYPDSKLPSLEKRLEALRTKHLLESYRVYGRELSKVDLLIAKNRHGPVGKMEMWFQKDINQFSIAVPE
ncbi:MAG: replicative DNA helicase [bacterium]